MTDVVFRGGVSRFEARVTRGVFGVQVFEVHDFGLGVSRFLVSEFRVLGAQVVCLEYWFSKFGNSRFWVSS